jgi:DNA end-binding protein Ku
MASRPVWKGFLRFSLVAVPVKTYTAAATGGGHIALNQLHADCHNRIQYKKTCPVHGEVKADQIVSGYQFDDGKFVIIDPDEIEKLRPPAEKAINVTSFINDCDVDFRYFSGKNYYLTPDGPIAQKPYALLLQAMEETGRAAMAEIVMHGRKHIALVRPMENLLAMSLMAYGAELKKLDEFKDEAPRLEVSPEELKLAKTLMDTLMVKDLDMDQYKDDYSDKLNQLIQAKIHGQQVVEQPGEEAPQVINLMEALQRSLAEAKKAPAAGAKPAKMVAAGTAGKAQAARKRKTS